MPVTRSKTKRDSSAHPNGANLADGNAGAEGPETEPTNSEDTVDLIEGHLSGLLKGMKTLRREVAELRKKNVALEEDLAGTRQEVENATQPKRGAKGRVGARELQKKVSELKGQVRELEKTHAKDKRKIAKLHAKEVKQDAQDLQDGLEYEVGDLAYKMRKLLRRFHDIMVTNALETDEECAICMTTMEVGKAKSFPCEHTFCDDCMTKLAAVAKPVRCPTCRTEANPDELEVVEYTATTQWDALLSVATSWAKMDRRREVDTSEEEAEEEFIDDEETADAKSVASEAPPANPLESSPEPEVDGGQGDGAEQLHASQTSRISRRVTSPPSENAASSSGANQGDPTAEAERASTPDPAPGSSQSGYLESPVAEKRKRMEELAQQRVLKRQRL